jgi:hypothetical protein
LDPNTRGWVPFTHHTDSHNKHEYSNSFYTEEHSHRKGKEKEKRGGRIVKSFLIFLVEKKDIFLVEKKDGYQMGKVGIGIYSCYLSWSALRTRELDRIQ